MKYIILPILLLVLVVGLCVCNGAIDKKSIDRLYEMANALPDIPDNNTEQELSKIYDLWDSKKELFSLVMKYDYVNNAAKELNSMIAGCKTQDNGTYLAAKKSFTEALSYIKDTQVVRVDNIF